MNIVTSALGHYERTGRPWTADCIIGHSFGTSTEWDSVNGQLGELLVDQKLGRPVVVDRTLADAIGDERILDHIVEGDISDATGGGVGSWGTLVEAKEFMEARGLLRPLMIAQAHHIGRVVMQAEKLGMRPIVPGRLPNDFDEDSKQPWTRNLALWVPREVVGSLVLRKQGKL